MMSRPRLAACACFTIVILGLAQDVGNATHLISASRGSQNSYPDVEIRFADTVKREMKTASGTLVLDAGARRLRVQSRKRPLDIAYDDVRQVIVEVDTFGKKAGFGASFLGMFTGGLLFGNAIATSIDKPFDNDHFVLIEYATPDGSTAQYLMSIPRKVAPRLLRALPPAFGERVVVPAFDEKTESVEGPTPHKKTAFAGFGTGTATQHPIPESRADKALVVVVTPATIMRRLRPERRGGGVTIRANDVPVGLSGPGTYTFFYLDPGDYFLASFTGQLVGLRMKLEAGKDYYLAQTIYTKGIRMRSFLRRHSKELVMHEVTGSLWTDSTIEPSAGTAGDK